MRGRLHLSLAVEDAVRHADLTIEAAPEKIELKVNLLGEVEMSAPPHAVFATNTSALSITELAAVLAATRVASAACTSSTPSIA